MSLFPSRQPNPKNPVAVVETPAKRPQAAPQQSIDVKAENIKSMIAAGEEFEGDMRLRYGLKLDGTVIGKIEFGSDDGMLVVNQHAVVEGDIYGPRAIILGEVRGNIVVTGKIIIMPTARISGDVAYGSIQMVEGAQMAGRLFPIAEFNNPAIRPETPEHANAHQAPAPEPSTPAAPPHASVLNFTANAMAATR